MSWGGSTTQLSEIPDWIKDPAIRQLERAEDMQSMEYMPWRGPHVAAYNDTQLAAMQQNIGAAEAFGLQAPGMTAAQGMPEPTTYADGTRGYSGIGLYEQALAETRAAQPDAMAIYDSLYGN